MIKLVKDTISSEEINSLCDWLRTYPQLTKGNLTKIFEKSWSEWLGRKYSVFVNSGSSANLAMLYTLKLSGRLKNNNVILPCVSWTTTVSPVIQLGMNPILCDASTEDLGLDTNQLEDLCKKYKPSCMILVHILGIPNDMAKILDICKRYEVILLEDSCESVGSLYDKKMTGTFGAMSTFSTYFGHHFSTIEGGLISTDDFELYEILKSIRSHGWARDLSEETKITLRNKYDIDNFKDLYTFYYPGFNFRATEIQAFLGITQLSSLDEKNKKRYDNLKIYDSLIKNNYWKLKFNTFISNFAYPIIHPKRDEIVETLNKNDIECRPLVCGNMARQPYFKDLYGIQKFNFADIVHDYGLYVPNNPDMTISEIEHICFTVNKVI